MTEADGGPRVASASEDAAAPVASGRVPFAIGDELKGFYTCAQGRTPMTLTVEDVHEEEEITMIFDFDFKGSATSVAAQGRYRVRGRYHPDTRQMHLEPDVWLQEPAPPAQSTMVSLVGRVSETGAYSGTLSGAPRCTTFSVTPSTKKPAK